MATIVEPGLSPPFVDTRGDWDEWRQKNKHRWKAPLEHEWRKIDRDHDAVWVLVEKPRDLEAELTEGLRIEASGWKGEGGTAIDSSPDTQLFYRKMAAASTPATSFASAGSPSTAPPSRSTSACSTASASTRSSRG